MIPGGCIQDNTGGFALKRSFLLTGGRNDLYQRHH
jgi:hypothetical protein